MFYKTVVEVTILSEEPYDIIDLDQIHYDITFGDCSGQCNIKSSEEVSAEEMKKLLKTQGSDPSFMGLNDND
jgi:hypothetical protein